MLCSFLAQCVPGVEGVWLLVTPENPLKPLAGGATDAQRLEMAALVADSLPRVQVSDFEFSLPRPSYTSQTLDALARRYPEHRFRLLIGSDNWLIFNRWHDWQGILERHGVDIYLRPGYPVDPATLPAAARLLEGTPVTDISSTFIRSCLEGGLDMNYFLPTAVYNYISEHHLYGNK